MKKFGTLSASYGCNWITHRSSDYLTYDQALAALIQKLNELDPAAEIVKIQNVQTCTITDHEQSEVAEGIAVIVFRGEYNDTAERERERQREREREELAAAFR